MSLIFASSIPLPSLLNTNGSFCHLLSKTNWFTLQILPVRFPLIFDYAF